MAAAEATTESAPTGKGSMIVTAGIIVFLSFAAIGIGYLVAAFVNQPDEPRVQAPAVSASTAEKAATAMEKGSGIGIELRPGGQHQVLKLEPIIVTLSRSSNTWLRLELALVIRNDAHAPDAGQQLQLMSDLSAFARNIKIDQLSSPSGYLHLQEDLLARSRHLLGQDVLDLLVLSLVAE